MTENPLVRLACAQTVQNFIDDSDYLWKDGCTDEETRNLQKYLRERGVNYPKIPSDERGEDVKKVMYRVWVSIECLNLMCELLGEDKRND
jgi:hypothetical protein